MSDSGVLSNVVFRKIFKAIVSYMGYFASRYVGNDIQMMCGNLLDHPIAKTFTLFCVMFQATDNFDIALIMTTAFLLAQYFMSVSPLCAPYKEKTQAKHVRTTATTWAHDESVDNYNIPKKQVDGHHHPQHAQHHREPVRVYGASGSAVDDSVVQNPT